MKCREVNLPREVNAILPIENVRDLFVYEPRRPTIPSRRTAGSNSAGPRVLGARARESAKRGRAPPRR